MLYGETLGPVLSALEGRLNQFLLPLLGLNPEKDYVEFNVEQRLRGSFEEQAAVFQTAVGGPWMTVNEARAKQNLPAVEGGDELIRPLNVTAPGDQEPVEAAPPEGGGSEPPETPASEDPPTEQEEQ